MLFTRKKTEMVAADAALPGRDTPMPVPPAHTVLGNPLRPPFPDGIETAIVALGCFWGAERIFWQLPGVYTTAVGYIAGYTKNPTYEEVCSGRTGHTEAVLIAFDPAKISYPTLLKHFWEGHDPTQGMRQGNDIGTQYRSGVYTTSEAQQEMAVRTRDAFQQALTAAGRGQISSEILPADEFFYAEDYHQQYLDKNPGGYCGLGGTGVCLPAAESA